MFGWDTVVESLLALGGKYIDDKTKQMEFATEVAKLGLQTQQVILEDKTSPFVDGLVKLMYASKDVLIPLLRPLGSAALSAFSAYCAYKHIDLGSMGIVMGAAFPGWMASRGIEKLTDKDK